jgi:biofilm PGA synthesis N-glycosyltransferase PgaC
MVTTGLKKSRIDPVALMKLRANREEIIAQLLASASTLAKKVPDMTDEEVTVIIPAYNEAAALVATLESIIQQTYRFCIREIVVVDDGSIDGTSDVARRYAKYGVRVIRLERDGTNTKSQAQNVAAKQVKTKYFLTVDADTVLAPNCVEKLLAGFKSPNVACVSGKVFPRYVRNMWEKARYGEYCVTYRVHKRVQNFWRFLLVCPGCCTLFRTDVVEEFGWFRKGTMAEDMELTMRIVIGGYEVGYEPEALCYPIEPDSRELIEKQLDRWYRGFLQCLMEFQDGSVWRFDRLWRKDWRLGLAATYYVGSIVLMPILTVTSLLFFWLYFHHQLLDSLIVTILGRAYVEWRPLLLEARSRGKSAKAVGCIPSMVGAQFLFTWIFLRSLYLEGWKKERLVKWNIGHRQDHLLQPATQMRLRVVGELVGVNK